jgi:hypothetical protein
LCPQTRAFAKGCTLAHYKDNQRGRGSLALLAAPAPRPRRFSFPFATRRSALAKGSSADEPDNQTRRGKIMTTTKTKTDSTTQRTAELNDLCRKAFWLAGRVFQTQGISALPQRDQSAIREKVELFDSFTEDNDPHGEHDFGAFEHEGERIFWKIDYYAPDMEHGSENPADPKQTVRVLTIMLASEY